MKKSKLIIFYIATLYSRSIFADLSCSANGTEIFYINGIMVKTKEENANSAKNIEKVIGERKNQIDKNSNVTVQGIYNFSTGFFNDINKLRNN